MMMEGKVHSAKRWLTNRPGGRVFDPNNEVFKSNTKLKKRVFGVLKEKHGVAQRSHQEARIKIDSLP